jgi:hypothetical protein
MTPSLRRALLATLPPLALAACVDNPISRHFEWQKHAETVEFAPEPLYCYRTLAQSTCYAQPLDRREANRVVGFYGPSPSRVVAAPPDKVDSEPLQLVPKQQSKAPIDNGTD